MENRAFFLGPVEHILYLKTLPALQQLSPTYIAAIAQHTRERFFSRGSFLIESGAVPRAFHLVIEGSVSVHRKDRPAQRIGPRQGVGFLHLLAGARTGLEAVAETDTLALEFDSEAQLDVCEEHFPILHSYLRFLCGQSILELQKSTDQTRFAGKAASFDGRERSLDLVERILILRRAQSLANVNLDALFELCRHIDERHFNPGDRLWRAGDAADHFLVPVSGSIKCTDEAGHQSWIWHAGSPIPPGLYEALSTQVRWHDAVVEEKTSVLRVKTDPLLDILDDDFQTAMNFIAVLSAQLIELLDR